MGEWLRPGRRCQPSLPLLRGSGPSSWLSPALACPWPHGSSYRGGFRGSILPSSAAGSVWTGSSRAIRHPTGATFGLALVPGDLGRSTHCPHPPGPGRAQRSAGARLRPEPPQLREQDWVGQGHGRPIPPWTAHRLLSRCWWKLPLCLTGPAPLAGGPPAPGSEGRSGRDTGNPPQMPVPGLMGGRAASAPRLPRGWPKAGGTPSPGLLTPLPADGPQLGQLALAPFPRIRAVRCPPSEAAPPAPSCRPAS